MGSECEGAGSVEMVNPQIRRIRNFRSRIVYDILYANYGDFATNKSYTIIILYDDLAHRLPLGELF